MSVKAKRIQHARERAITRFGVVLTKALHADIVRQITSGLSAPVTDANRSLAIRCRVVDLGGGKKAAVLYDKDRKIVVTVLPGNGAEMQHYLAKVERT